MRWRVLTLGIAVVAGVVLGAISADAHHSIAGVYDSTRPVTLQGVITQFQFVNPHPFVLMEASDAKGAPQQWRLEMDNRSELADVGMTKDTLRSGDRIVVTGSLARNGTQGLYVRKLERPADGFTYEQVGSSPRVTRR
jgi:uncharacterized protein DUF6152